MPFMQIEVTGREAWIEVDGPNGVDIIPCAVCGNLPDYVDTIADCPDGDDPDEYFIQAAFEQVSDYTENRECHSIEQVVGYGGRLSAPGYLDCTDWILADSAGEARRSVCAVYELCPACEESADGPKSKDNPACNFYHY